MSEFYTVSFILFEYCFQIKIHKVEEVSLNFHQIVAERRHVPILSCIHIWFKTTYSKFREKKKASICTLKNFIGLVKRNVSTLLGHACICSFKKIYYKIHSLAPY